VSEDGRVETEFTVERTRIGIHEQLGRIPASAVLGIPRPVDAEAVRRSGGNARHMTVEDPEGLLGQSDPLLVARIIEEAEIHAGGARCPQGDVGTGGIEGEAEWIPGSGPVDRRLHMPLWLPAPRGPPALSRWAQATLLGCRGAGLLSARTRTQEARHDR